MSDHDFERQVRQKMDELKFRPSNAVWQGVQERIRSERPRRRVVIWLPVLLALLGTGGYLFLNRDARTNTLSETTKQLTTDKTNADDKNVTLKTFDNNQPTSNIPSAVRDEAGQNHTGPRNEATPGAVGKTTLASLSDNSNTVSKKNNSKAAPVIKKPLTALNSSTTNIAENKRKQLVNGKNNRAGQDLAGRKNDKPDAVNNELISAITDKNQPVNDKLADVATDSTFPRAGTTEVADSAAEEIDVDKKDKTTGDSAVAQSAAPINTKAKKNKLRTKIEWGFAASGGIAKLQEGKLGSLFHATNLADAPPVGLQTSNNFLFAPNTSAVARPTASVVKPGLAFSAGGYVKVPLSKRFSVSAGLMYSQMNNIIYVGNRVDSSRLVNSGAQVANVSRYYRPDHRSRFSNRYHFVEIPVQLHTQLNKSTTTPLLWNVGVSFSQMIASDALLFDSGTGVYYKDDAQYRNTQLSFSTGFSIGVFSKSKTPLWIGPSVKYHTTPLFNNHFVGKKHLAAASIDLRFQLNK
ncbi:MAG: hypothetical protein EOO04_07065 [Chitinophagaceae bacterium]|nr:MAG: hypothetical protein EOO04_07065 [Chitinophagaceae bacterium]